LFGTIGSGRRGGEFAADNLKRGLDL